MDGSVMRAGAAHVPFEVPRATQTEARSTFTVASNTEAATTAFPVASRPRSKSVKDDTPLGAGITDTGAVHLVADVWRVDSTPFAV
jgi:hypothetical protein